MKKQIYPSTGPKPAGPYSPGVLCGDFLYVSGLGSRPPAGGDLPADFPSQIRNALTNIRLIVEAGGFSMKDVLYSQVFLADMSQFPALAGIWKETYPDGGPAFSVQGVARMPTDIPVQINAVATRNAARPHPDVREAGGRLYFSGVGGATPAAAMENLAKRAKSAGIDLGHFAFLNAYCSNGVTLAQLNEAYAPYFDAGNAPARASMLVDSLPPGMSVELTGVAVRDLSTRRVVRPRNMPPSRTSSPGVWAGDMFYLSAKSGFIPGPQAGIYATSVEHQVRQTMRNLLDGLEETGLDFSHAVATNVYLDDVGEFVKMNTTYASYFKDVPPTRSTVQPLKTVERKPNPNGSFPMLEQISLVAWKG
ncbi:MAG TPA: Rid family hydrolase [Bryobacteraceae bacterium]|nr:Rid family hydrolase [Bryobacteraceae bacterium]